jgi:GntR family transcriptional regulator
MNAVAEPELIIQSGMPIHRQIADQIRRQIVSGALEPGEELPSLRALAVGLAVNLKAVVRATRRLEREGWLTTVDNSGIFVSGPAPVCVAPSKSRTRLERLCARWLARAERSGFSAAEVVNTMQTLTQRRSQP